MIFNSTGVSTTDSFAGSCFRPLTGIMIFNKKNIGDKEYTDLIDQIKKVDILYIDDFLKVPVGDEIGRPSQADLSLALEIINYRYNNKLVTLISSEWTSNEIIGFDEALGSRICEMAGKSNLNILRDRKKNMRMRAMEL